MKPRISIAVFALFFAAMAVRCADAAEPVAPGMRQAAAAQAGEKELNDALDKLLRAELFMTLGGVKPITTRGCSQRAYDVVSEAVSGGKITNPDIVFFRFAGKIGMLSRSAVARLAKDRTARSVFKRYAMPFPSGAEGWIDAFKTAQSPTDSKSSLGSDIVQGVGYGYPPLEAEAFALQSRVEAQARGARLSSDKDLLRLLAEAHVPVPANDAQWEELGRRAGAAVIAKQSQPWQSALFDIEAAFTLSERQPVGLDIEGFDAPGYMRFTNAELERDGYYLRASFRLAKNYEQLIREGRTPLEIVNHPQWIEKGLPAFPEGLLEH